MDCLLVRVGCFLWDEPRLFAGSEDMYVGLLPLCIAWHFIRRFGTESAELEFLLMLRESRRRITDMISSRFSDTGRFPNKYDEYPTLLGESRLRRYPNRGY